MTQTRIEEHVVEGKRLGRHINHDPRSRAYGFTAKVPTLISTMHQRVTPILDQGSVGSCVGNSVAGACGTAPLFRTAGWPALDEQEALKLYSAATLLDTAPGSYPPDDTGSDGLSGAKAAVQAGLASGYQHAFSLSDALTALQTYPVITGVNWYDSFDTPDSNGLVTITAGAQVRGGHEFEVVGLDVINHTVRCANSWGTAYGDKGYFSLSWNDWSRLLGEQGDVTVLLPLTVPAPNPAPTPVPPVPATAQADQDLALALHHWLSTKPWWYKTTQQAAQTWLSLKGL